MTSPIVNSTFAAEAVTRTVLCQYSLSPTATCQFLQLGMNDTYLVIDGARTLYLRIYRAGTCNQQQILGELRAILFLAQAGLRVAEPVPTADGRLLVELEAPEGTRYAALFREAVSGGDIGTQVFVRLGRLTARMHVVSDSLPDDILRPRIDEPYLIDRSLELLEPWMHGTESLDRLRSLAGQLRNFLSGLGREAPEFGFIHCDIPNVHVDPTGELTLFDFDLCGRGWRAYDLAVVLWLISKNGQANSTSTEERWNLLVSGYESERGLSESERRSLMAFVPIRHLWMMGTHACTAVFHGRNMNGLSPEYFAGGVDFIDRWVQEHPCEPR